MYFFTDFNSNVFGFFEMFIFSCFRSNESIIYQTMDANWLKPDPDLITITRAVTSSAKPTSTDRGTAQPSTVSTMASLSSAMPTSTDRGTAQLSTASTVSSLSSATLTSTDRGTAYDSIHHVIYKFSYTAYAKLYR